MMYIEIYFLMQLIILITLIVLYRKDYIAPEVIYSASMVLSSFSYIQLKDLALIGKILFSMTMLR